MVQDRRFFFTIDPGLALSFEKTGEGKYLVRVIEGDFLPEQNYVLLSKGRTYLSNEDGHGLAFDFCHLKTDPCGRIAAVNIFPVQYACQNSLQYKMDAASCKRCSKVLGEGFPVDERLDQAWFAISFSRNSSFMFRDERNLLSRLLSKEVVETLWTKSVSRVFTVQSRGTVLSVKVTPDGLYCSPEPSLMQRFKP